MSYSAFLLVEPQAFVGCSIVLAVSMWFIKLKSAVVPRALILLKTDEYGKERFKAGIKKNSDNGYIFYG